MKGQPSMSAENKPEDTQAAPEEGLLEELNNWWCIQRKLWSSLNVLLQAEGALALKSLLQLIVGIGVLLVFLLLCIILLESLVALLLFKLGASIVSTILLLLALNILCLFTVYSTLRQLPKNFKFQHSLAYFNGQTSGRPIARDDSQDTSKDGAEE